MESAEVHCALATSKWAGHSLRLVPWDPPFLQTLLHQGPNPFPLVSVTKLPLKTQQEAQAPGLSGSDLMSREPSAPLPALEEETRLTQQTRTDKPYASFLTQSKLPKETSQSAAQGASAKPSKTRIFLYHYLMLTAKAPVSTAG